MSEIHQSRPALREGGIQNGSLSVREEERLETGIRGKAQTNGNGRAGKTKHDDQGHKKRDPNLDNEAVKKYRDIVHLQANYLQRAEIAATVDERGLRVWEAVLTEHMLHGWNPKDVLRMLRTYELQRYP